MINWVLLVLTLILLFWHISADLVTKKSHQRLTKGWGFFTLIAALLFLILIIFQICSIEEIYKLKEVQDFIDWLPDVIKNNKNIIGFDNYVDYSSYERGIKFLAYVAYFNLSVITKRQLKRSALKVRMYETRNLLQVNEVGSESSSDHGDDVKEVGFSIVFVVYKFRVLWPLLDVICWNTFTLLTVAVVLLAIQWKLSFATLLYIIILMIYYILTPFFLQPNLKDSGKKFKESMGQKELSEM